MLPSIRRLRDDRRAATAVEFAFVSSFFLLSMLFIMYVGLISYFQMCLDFATYKAARQVMIGAVAHSGISQSQMITTQVCPYLPLGMVCSNVILNLYSVAEAAQPAGYYGFVNSSQTALNIPALNNSSASFDLGTNGPYEYLQVIYPLTAMPKFIGTLFGSGQTYNGSPAYLIVSTAAFKNEPSQ